MTSSAEDLQIETETTAEPSSPEAPVHEARCGSCPAGVRFRRTEHGGGIIVLDRFGVDGEASFGIGESGNPTCPNGHGEMALADEQLPAAEAFELAQEKLAAAAGHGEQQRLPGVVLPFNFQGAYLELEEKAVEVDRLHAEYKAAAEEAKDAKKAWDKAAELYTKMALECRRRRRAKEGEPAEDLLDASESEPETNLVTCKWHEQHPGETCPICANVEYARRYFDGDLAPRDSVRHIDQVDGWMLDREVNGVIDALDNLDIVVTSALVIGWSAEERAEVTGWATATLDGRDDSTITIPARPKVLGTGHVAGDGRDGEAQSCTQCDAVLIAAGDDLNYYEAGVLVGVDCPGKAKAEGQHYPTRKPRGRRKKTDAAVAE